ncbi:RVT_3 domain-containing protein [Gossypium australe]|uniref:RVT_3 domain-containing protein n=1 Tax=Gossypium australe TaxID=47621 RepID=A0A5B6VW71_9ROSI|nr:RVT_3 domain-containing protein [Gossypium australe]
MANQPMKEVLSKADTSGRLTKWSIEFDEFGVEFTRRTTIKWQVLADFIMECSFQKLVGPAAIQFVISIMIHDEFVLYSKISFPLVVHNLVVSPPQKGAHTTDSWKSWLVYIDGFAAKAGSGVGLLMIDPTGNE